MTDDTTINEDSLEEILSQDCRNLLPGGPAVDYEVLHAYLDRDLPDSLSNEVRTRIATWAEWHYAYWETLALLDCYNTGLRNSPSEYTPPRSTDPVPERSEGDSQEKQVDTTRATLFPRDSTVVPRTLATKFYARPSAFEGSFREGEGGSPDQLDTRTWELTTESGDLNIQLPEPIAQDSYAAASQIVTIKLHKVVDGEVAEPQVEISPPPAQRPLHFVMFFPDGSRSDLTVPVPRGRRMSSVSLRSPSVPASAFGIGQWSVAISFVATSEANS
ncbi:MAG: hypothetical protein ACSLE1_02685 [Sphingobium sp.]